MDIKSVIIKRYKQTIVCVVIVTGVIFFAWPSHTIYDQQEVISSETLSDYRTVIDYDPDTFFAGVSKAKIVDDLSLERVNAGVVPHHLLPGEIISDFFGRLSKQKITTVYIIGPNHYNTGEKIITAANGWRTVFGDVDIDKKNLRLCIRKLICSLMMWRWIENIRSMV